MDLTSLKHTKKDLSNGGMILALNTGAIINPEAEAMLQALHSRSIGGINSHLEVLAKKGAENFMANFYVGYGHKSIGDCGTITLFIEGVSMLTAKAIQDWPLYSGQEASTRYIDFANQPFVDPKGTKQSKEVLENWRSFYMKGLSKLGEALPKRFPRGENEDEKIYTKAIKARAFDIMRSFLPSGATTNLAWHTNLRQAADHVMRLRHHPLKEVRNIAEKLEELLLETFPSSFGHKRYDNTENFNKEWMQKEYYYTNKKSPEFTLSRNSINKKTLSKYKKILSKRPAKTEIPKEVAEAGQVQFEFLLDFGSFRDIQRHRAVLQRMPLVTMDHGFGEWYLEELPNDLRKEALVLLKKQKQEIKKLKLDKTEEQYYIPMGYKLPNKLTGSIPHIVYLSELRCTRFVHPTLRSIAIKMAEALRKKFKNEGLTIHTDKDPDRFDVNRGKHDIVAKN
jgi:thymidylate synthase ThyX